MPAKQSKKPILHLKAPAKINLYLKVFDQRPDGYHNLHSLMQMIGLYDTLSFEEAGNETSLQVENQVLPQDQSNLILQAATLLQKEMKALDLKPRGVHIHLKKNIPIAAGLAGGSSDAVTTLLALNQLWDLSWPKARLQQLSAQLGSDLPFFFQGPTAWVSGRGERVQSTPPLFNHSLVLVYPKISVSTASIFQAYSEQDSLTKESLPHKIGLRGEQLTLDVLIQHPTNDLEPHTLKLFPQLKALKESIQSFGGVLTLMSGSGSSFITLFEDKKEAERTARALRSKVEFGPLQIWVLPLLQSSPFASFL